MNTCDLAMSRCNHGNGHLRDVTDMWSIYVVTEYSVYKPCVRHVARPPLSVLATVKHGSAI